jgi:hypothetical protein
VATEGATEGASVATAVVTEVAAAAGLEAEVARLEAAVGCSRPEAQEAAAAEEKVAAAD